MARRSDSAETAKIEHAVAGDDGAREGAPTRVVAIAIDDRARRSSPPPAVAITPMVEVVTHGPRRLASKATTQTHGMTAAPAAAAPSAPEADAEPVPQELPRVRRARGEPEWSSKPTEMDLPRVGDFVPEHESISTRAPTPRMLPLAARDAQPSVAAPILTALIALLALAVVLALIVGLGRAP